MGSTFALMAMLFSCAVSQPTGTADTGTLAGFKCQKNAIKHEITATHLRGSGMEIRIPILVSDSEKSQSESTTKTAAKAKADESIEKVHRKSLAERLNRGWDDPEGVLVEEDYKVSGDARDEDGLLQVIEMDSSISYAKDIDAVSGYIDVRGAWHSY